MFGKLLRWCLCILYYQSNEFVVFVCLIKALILVAVGFICIRSFVAFCLLLCYTCGLFVECAF